MPAEHNPGSRPTFPLYTEGRGGFDAPSPRWCAQVWKSGELTKAVSSLPKGSEVWIPVPADEWLRVRSDLVPNATLVYPLIDRKITRAMCEADFPDAPPSHCLHCAFQSDTQWKRLKSTPDFEKVCAMEESQHWRGERGYFHPSLKPLTEIDLRAHPGAWASECWGLCGN
jgi:hypothetical protein